MKTRKYDYLYILQGHYGYGWEDLSAEQKEFSSSYCSKALQKIRQTRKEYRENEGGNYRIISRREIIN